VPTDEALIRRSYHLRLRSGFPNQAVWSDMMAGLLAAT
jgi:hypothetical protein